MRAPVRNVLPGVIRQGIPHNRTQRYERDKFLGFRCLHLGLAGGGGDGASRNMWRMWIRRFRRKSDCHAGYNVARQGRGNSTRWESTMSATVTSIASIINDSILPAYELSVARFEKALDDARPSADERKAVEDGVASLMSRLGEDIARNGQAYVTGEQARMAVRMSDDPTGYETALFWDLRSRGNALLALIANSLRGKGYQVSYNGKQDILLVSTL